MQVRLFRPSLAPSGHSQKYDPCVLVHSSEHPPLFILHSSTSRINISKIFNMAEFPVGGAQTLQGGQHTILPIFQTSCIKLRVPPLHGVSLLKYLRFFLILF